MRHLFVFRRRSSGGCSSFNKMRKKNGEGSSQALGRGTQKSRGMLTEIYEMNNYDSNYCGLATSIQSWKNLYLSLNKRIK